MLALQVGRLVETLVRPFPPEEVTTRNPEEAPPEAAGLSSDDVRAIWRAVEAFYATGLHPAVGLCLRRHGKLVIDRAIGHVSGNAPSDAPDVPKVLATPRTLWNLFSASKAVTAMLVHLLDQRHEIHLDDPVAEYIPGFGANGKEWITIRHVLTHRAGIPSVAGAEIDLELLQHWDRIVNLLCAARPTWRPGRRLAYHALTGGYVLGEVIRRVTGLDARAFLNREVRDPLGFEDFSFGVPPSKFDRVAKHAFTGPRIVFPFTVLLKRVLGVRFEDAARLSNDPLFLTAVVPAGNLIAQASEVARFFELLLRGGELDGVRIFDARTVRRAVAEQSYLELDLTMGVPVRYGMGFVLGGEVLSLYGPRTPAAFGHLGMTNIVAWADPERDIAGCLMTSGKPFITARLYYFYDVMRQIANRVPRNGGTR